MCLCEYDSSYSHLLYYWSPFVCQHTSAASPKCCCPSSVQPPHVFSHYSSCSFTPHTFCCSSSPVQDSGAGLQGSQAMVKPSGNYHGLRMKPVRKYLKVHYHRWPLDAPWLPFKKLFSRNIKSIIFSNNSLWLNSGPLISVLVVILGIIAPLVRFKDVIVGFDVYCVGIDWQLWLTLLSPAALPGSSTLGLLELLLQWFFSKHTVLPHNISVCLILFAINNTCPVSAISLK